jgi:hypothetical protein
MKSLIAGLVAMAFLALTGCEKPASKPQNPPVEVNAPGVQVKVDDQKGVEVKAPGVDVETK